MAGLVSAMHVFICRRALESKTWMPAPSAGFLVVPIPSILLKRTTSVVL
jgi:hypothetical protein